VHYVCAACGRIYELSALRWRCDCGGILDLTDVPFTLEAIEPDRSGIWRYARLLPPVSAEARSRLGEQMTPLLDHSDLGVHLKLDHLLPSGSYKDRGACLLVSRLRYLGVRDVVLDSSGNAGAAIAVQSADEAPLGARLSAGIEGARASVVDGRCAATLKGWILASSVN